MKIGVSKKVLTGVLSMSMILGMCNASAIGHAQTSSRQTEEQSDTMDIAFVTEVRFSEEEAEKSCYGSDSAHEGKLYMGEKL